jgi:catechol 2,3-dioxygenase
MSISPSPRFKLHQRDADTAYLGAGGSDLLVLTAQVDPVPRPARSTGLYHFAILVPTRLELAHVLHNLIETQTPVTGFADHAVSEAIYLDDNEGNGIEMYWDRPRSAWYDQQGQFLLTTLPLDLESVLAELEGQPKEWSGLHSDTVLGHMHLKVGTLAEANHFYCEVLNFDLMLRIRAHSRHQQMRPDCVASLSCCRIRLRWTV